MYRQQFRDLCNKRGHNNPSAIEDALLELLQTQPGKVITVPRKEYFDPETDDEKCENACLVDFLTGGDSTEVSNTDDNDSEAYIASIHLSVCNPRKIIVRVYCYYESEFREVYLNRLADSRAAMLFALEYGKFEDTEQEKPDASQLSERQKDLLDEFLAAAERLNEAGVSLVWDEDDNSLCAVNRDAMKDNSFFRYDATLDTLPEGAVLFSEVNCEALDLEISYASMDMDLYYFPETQN